MVFHLANKTQRLGERPVDEGINPVRVNFSIPLSLAVALRAGRLTPTELDEANLAKGQDEIKALASKIEVRHDWTMTLQMLDAMAAHFPLGKLLSEIDIRQILAQRSEVGRQYGMLSNLTPKDLLRLTAFLWERAPDLVRHAGKAAADGIGRLVGGGREGASDGFDLAEADFAAMSMPFGAQVSLVLRGDKRYTARVDVPRGAAGRDQAETRGLVRKKFRGQAAPLISEDQVTRAIALVEDLENLADLGELTSALSVSH